MKTIDWQAMSHDELESTLEEGREEATRRALSYLALLGMGGTEPGKPGRKAANPLAALLSLAGRVRENQDSEPASAAAE